MNRWQQIMFTSLAVAIAVAPTKAQEHEEFSSDSGSGQTSLVSRPLSDIGAAVYICAGPPVARFFADKDSNESATTLYKFAWTDPCRQAERGQSILINFMLSQRIAVL